jgi:hypothetical protein
MTSRVRVAFGPALVAALVLALAACGDGGGPSTGPSPPGGFDLTGTWRGTASDSSGPGQMVWQITQSGGSLTGTLTMTDTATNLTGRGTITGTIAGATVTFAISIPAGGFDAPHQTCTAQVSGDAQLASSTLTGSYTGTNSCAGAIVSGQLTLDKQ